MAEAGPNRDAIAEELPSFDGTASSDPGGTIVGYAWNFGAGTTAAGPTATHAYAAAGTFVVTLTVTDDEVATASATAVVTAQAPAEAIRSLSALVSTCNLKQGIAGAPDE